MAESTMRGYIIPNIRRLPASDATAIENAVASGTPDINACSMGDELWIECKVIKELPKRDHTAITIKHYTPEQYIWLRKRSQAGGRVFICIKVEKPKTEYFFLDFRGCDLLYHKKMTSLVLRKSSIFIAGRSINFPNLLETLCYAQ